MLNRCLDAVVAALLLVALLPSLAWYTLRAGLRSRATAFRRAKSARIASLKQQIASEFNFEHAIEAYEELIDATLSEGRP